MRTLRSHVMGRWHQPDDAFHSLVNPSTEEPVARASSKGVDFAAVMEYARTVGLPALRQLTYGERGELLKAMSVALRESRDELLELSRLNGGATVSDGAFDIDGATGTLAWYSRVARDLSGRGELPEEDEPVPLGRQGTFVGRHLYVPRAGVAVQINAFNFPAWGFAEKAACALLAGMPVVTKPATATALVTERCVEILVEQKILPDGALQFIAGGPGDLLDHLGPQDVVAFTGSAATARTLRSHPRILDSSPRLNVEADSLNAAVLDDGAAGDPAFLDYFVADMVREITQKAGQKCTAARRVLVPEAVRDRVVQALREGLDAVVPGDPAESGVTMGPVATAGQLEDCLEGIRLLREGGRLVHGTGVRFDGRGVPPGRGYFLGPTLLEPSRSEVGAAVHTREVFGPVASLLIYSGDPDEAAELVGRAGGTLVTSVYGSDPAWVEAFLAGVGPHTGRIYVGHPSVADEAPGSGMVMPQSVHGGPGRAGGGEELGGVRGVKRYMQRVALQAPSSFVTR